MGARVLILQSDRLVAQTLIRFFNRRGDQVWQTSSAEKAIASLPQVKPDLVLVDLHLPGNGWLDFLRLVHQESPQTQIIVTNKYPDFQRELLAKEQGASVFLRQPFTNQWIEAAIRRLNQDTRPGGSVREAEKIQQPKVRMPVRLKITIPYALLALFFALSGAYMVSQLVLESIETRYNSQLIATGKQNADLMVQEEDARLKTLRLIANTQGVADLIRAGDADGLRQAIYPLAVNAREDAIELIDNQGVGVLSLRHVPGGNVEEYTFARGDSVYLQWDFVQYVLQRRQDQGMDKSAGTVRAPWGDFFYVSGPILDTQGQLAGVVLVGRSLPDLVREMREANLAEVTLYDFSGNPIASSLSLSNPRELSLSSEEIGNALGGQDKISITRDLTLASNQYREILGPWEARNKEDQGILGTSLPQQFLTNTSMATRTQIFALITLAFLLVIIVGVFLANHITRPLLRVVRASTEVAKGNLEVKVEQSGNDEVAVLAHSFNTMVASLQEGSIYRDLLGRTVSPEVREQLRQTFTSGNVRLEGQEAIATVLMSDIRGFTSLSEKSDPATVFKWLNEYFSELVPIVTANYGVVNKFDGDAMLCFFGILPRLLNPRQSAYYACKAAVEILEAIDRLNAQRVERGEQPLATGIGINTGVVTAGGLGTSDRLHYTIIGDTVNTTQRLESLTRDLFNVNGVLISQATYNALGDTRSDFHIESAGIHAVKGKMAQLMVYRLYPNGFSGEASGEKAAPQLEGAPISSANGAEEGNGHPAISAEESRSMDVVDEELELSPEGVDLCSDPQTGGESK
ncbi:MAG TPA: adenylate/guanylate cyclase domain-containing protein [Anaerolineaceae bacterium]|nr:adenylate/guanylate cyclase domain-containing protein [Anaerolineaceae bacterium]